VGAEQWPDEEEEGEPGVRVVVVDELLFVMCSSCCDMLLVGVSTRLLMGSDWERAGEELVSAISGMKEVLDTQGVVLFFEWFISWKKP